MSHTPHITNDSPAEGSSEVTERELKRKADEIVAADQKTAPEAANDDDIPLATQQEAAREHQDTYVVKTDLEDADQRSIPGTREQP